MTEPIPLAAPQVEGHWLSDPVHRAWLWEDVQSQLRFFHRSLRAEGGFDVLDWDGVPIPGPQELHTTTRLVHSYALGHALGDDKASRIVDAGMEVLWRKHRDPDQGGYFWSVEGGNVADGTKLAYGHVFVLLAASSARMIGHPESDRLLDDITAVIERHFWDDDRGLLRDEFAQDWSAFSSYRGMNANMHGVEALLAAHEATGDAIHLERAGRILDFFVGRMAPAHDWRLPEHYTEDWEVDPTYQGNPMFRPAGTTPGHSLEFARLLLQHWDLAGRPDTGAVAQAQHLMDRALSDAWLEDGGLAYTLDRDGNVAIEDRYWWPVAEAIGAVATLIKVAPRPEDETWYRRLWSFADRHFIDNARGGWYPEIGPDGAPVARQFRGKPDIYHSLQASLLPTLSGISRPIEELKNKPAPAKP
ncbi:MAG: AGE family epimerase/isomerase [Rhodobacteraceae bacterium]|nr:AGE family epimerase/isomerase [Paracoccaceae bacterium]